MYQKREQLLQQQLFVIVVIFLSDNLTTLESQYLESYQSKYKYIYHHNSSSSSSSGASLVMVDSSNFRHVVSQCLMYNLNRVLHHNHTIATYCKWHASALYPGLLG